MIHRFDTRSLHAGEAVDPATGARATPIYQTAAYEFPDAATAADRYALADDGDVYTRVSNPTTRALEERLASLSGGVAAVATASGMAALDAITTTLAQAGDNIVAAADAYGGTTTYFEHTLPRRGVTVRTVDTRDYEAYREAIDDDTAYVHVETIANPSLVTPDLERIADLAHERATPLVVDNTFATPALCRPVEHGADVVWESTTKWLGGAGTTVGGVAIDAGTFPWDHPDADYAELSGENPAFGVDFVERFGSEAFARVVRQRAVRPTGSQQSPFDAWQTLQGIQTLPLRVDRHCENARRVAAFLRDHSAVEWVTYPGFDDHPTRENAARYLDDDGGMIAFGLTDGYEAGRRLCEAVELISFLANVGDAKTLLVHPASTTHAQLSPAEQREAGVAPELLRLSVGIEAATDIVADLDRAIERATDGDGPHPDDGRAAGVDGDDSGDESNPDPGATGEERR